MEAQALAEEVGSYRFLICCVVWCEILTITNKVNKLLQSSSMQLDIAVNLISNAKASLTRGANLSPFGEIRRFHLQIGHSRESCRSVKKIFEERRGGGGSSSDL